MTTFLREAFRVKRRSYPERIRSALFLAIKRTSANLDACVKVPGKDFSRTRKLPLQAMLLMLIGMGSGSLSKELYDWFGYTSSTATASAFVQQRNKIRPEAVKMIFNEFVSSTTPTVNCTPFVRQYDILSKKWGVLLCQKEYQTNDIRRNSREWL